jgi:hypothetical protein
LPHHFLTGLKKKIKEHVTDSVSSVRLHSKIQPGVPFIEIKERIVDKAKRGRSKSRAMSITNSIAIRDDFSHERWMDTRLYLLSNVGSFESVHLGCGAKYHPPPVDGDASAGDNSGDEDSSLISEDMKLSCPLKTEETSITSSHNSHPPKQLPTTINMDKQLSSRIQ